MMAGATANKKKCEKRSLTGSAVVVEKIALKVLLVSQVGTALVPNSTTKYIT